MTGDLATDVRGGTISAEGRYVVFTLGQDDIVSGDDNGKLDAGDGGGQRLRQTLWDQFSGQF